MREIEFIENTWIRKVLREGKDATIGHMAEGTTIKVKDEIIESDFIVTDEVLKNRIESNKWFTCENGWYYWYGSTKSGYSSLVPLKSRLIAEAQLSVSPLHWQSIVFDKSSMSDTVKDYGIIKNFWSSNILGENIKVAILDSGFKPIMNTLPNNRLFNCTNEEKQNNFYNEKNHGGKSIALLKYLSATYTSLIPKADVYFFKVKKRAEPNSSTVVTSIIRALTICIKEEIPLVNISLAFSSRKVPSDLMKALEAKIKEYSRIGQIICASGNLANVRSNEDGLDLIPARFERTICIGSYKMSGDKKISNSLENKNVKFRIKGDNILLPYNLMYSNSSAATVIFTGLMVLLKGKFPNLSWKELFSFIHAHQPSDNKFFSVTEFLNEIK